MVKVNPFACLAVGSAVAVGIYVYNLPPSMPISEEVLAAKDLSEVRIQPIKANEHTQRASSLIQQFEDKVASLDDAMIDDGGQSDDEWANIAKLVYISRHTLAWDLANHTDSIPINYLFIHKELNPRKVYIPAYERQHMARVWKFGCENLYQMARTRARARAEEFNKRMKDGTQRQFDAIEMAKERFSGPKLEEYMRVYEKGRVLVDDFFPSGKTPPVYRVVGSTVYYGLEKDFPVTTMVSHIRNNLVLQMCSALLSWFGDVAQLSEHEQFRILSEIGDELNGT